MHKKTVAILFLVMICVSMTGLFYFAAHVIYGYAKGNPLIKGQMQRVNGELHTGSQINSDTVGETQNAETAMSAENSDSHATDNKISLFYLSEKSNLIHNRFKWLKGIIESHVNEKIYLRFAYIEAYGFLQTAMNKQMADGSGLIKLNNGYLTSLQSKSNQLEEWSSKIIDLNTYLRRKQIHFLYVQTPLKMSTADKQMLMGAEDYSNENSDKFLSLIGGAGVDFIDLRTELQNDQISSYDMYFVTDHHWKPEAALWAAGKVSKKLNTQYGFHIDQRLYDSLYYNYEVYEEWFLGSWGRRVGALYSGVDDMTLITPKFATSFSMAIPSKSIQKSGAFQDVMFDYTKLEEKVSFDTDTHQVYMGGRHPFVQIRNEMASDKKILLIRDSFSNTFAPFMALGCREIDMIDLRMKPDFTVKEYVDQLKPDLVMILYSIPFEEPEFFEFGKSKG